MLSQKSIYPSFAKSAAKVAKGISIFSTRVDTVTSYTELKSRGYSDEQAILVSSRRTGVNLAMSQAGGKIGGWLASVGVGALQRGAALIPFAYMIGEFFGSLAGDYIAKGINKLLDKQYYKNTNPKQV